jgi:hypothetical protein
MVGALCRFETPLGVCWTTAHPVTKALSRAGQRIEIAANAPAIIDRIIVFSQIIPLCRPPNTPWDQCLDSIGPTALNGMMP